jgi:tRNA 2-selenouridine synthase
MSVQKLSAAQAIDRLAEFSSIIDARSPGEFAEDHLPKAENWPSLDNDERKEVGTDYKQVGGFEAKKIGAALVARNIAEHIDAHVRDKPANWKPLVYCWRGGKRSGTLAWFLDQIGFETTVVDGGYKAFRAAMVEDLAALPQRFQFRVICGRTGSGKTRLLHALARQGAQVLDLEGFAQHRGSVLGWLPDTPQPTQKRFDTLVWHALRGLDPARGVWVEAESKKIGNLQVPESLLAHMREQSACVNIELPLPERVKLLLDEYSFFVADPEYFCARVAALKQHCGGAAVARWQELARAGDCATAFEELMTQHYDPIYLQSMQRNFRDYPKARSVAPESCDVKAFDTTATALIASDAIN